MRTHKETNDITFNRLPKDVSYEITSHINPSSLYNLMLLNKENYNFFKPMVMKIQLIKALSDKDWEKVEKIILLQPKILVETSYHLVGFLLNLVVQGNQEEAKKLITLSPILLTKKADVTDLSGRTFRNITPFQYILWSLDVRHMGQMMIDSIPIDNEEGRKIILNLMQQFDNHENESISYFLNDQKITEKHHNIVPFVDSIHYYFAHYINMNPDERNIYWNDNICKNQSQFPVHVAQHYSEPCVSLFPLPDFKKDTLNRCLNVTIFNKSLDTVWYSPHFNTCDGNKLCIIRGNRADWKPFAFSVNIPYRADHYLQMAKYDALALTELYKIRIEDYYNISTQLFSLSINTGETTNLFLK